MQYGMVLLQQTNLISYPYCDVQRQRKREKRAGVALFGKETFTVLVGIGTHFYLRNIILMNEYFI